MLGTVRRMGGAKTLVIVTRPVRIEDQSTMLGELDSENWKRLSGCLPSTLRKLLSDSPSFTCSAHTTVKMIISRTSPRHGKREIRPISLAPRMTSYVWMA